jgi:hypothetical protein
MPRYGETSRGKTVLHPTDVARTCARKFCLESPAVLRQRRIIRRLKAAKSVACRYEADVSIGVVCHERRLSTAARNCTRDGGGPSEVGNQVLISSHRKLPLSKAMVVSWKRRDNDFGGHG